MKEEFTKLFMTKEGGQIEVRSGSKDQGGYYAPYQEIESTPVRTPLKREKCPESEAEGVDSVLLGIALLFIHLVAAVIAVFVAGWLLFQGVLLLWEQVLGVLRLFKAWLIDSGAAWGAGALVVFYLLYRSHRTTQRDKRRARNRKRYRDQVVPFDFEEGGGRTSSDGPTIIHNYFFNQKDK